MVRHTLQVDKEAVYEEVAKTSGYTGKKMEKDGAYDRIAVTPENREILERFWNESKNDMTGQLKKFLVSEEESGGKYTLLLELSSSFDDSLLPSMERSLFSFFVLGITAKWYAFTNKGEAQEYMEAAGRMADDILRKAYFKKKPVRPTYDD